MGSWRSGSVFGILGLSFTSPCAQRPRNCMAFGLYPRKGTIAIGSDADLVIFDPGRKHTISAKTHHMRVDYSMFEGIQVTGMPDIVLSRGKVVVNQEKFLGHAGRGEFLKRSTFTNVNG